MSQPQPYTPTTDFSQQEANNASGRSTVNTAALDAEFANIETTLDQLVENIQLVQRDDGKLGDVLVEVRCLAPDTLNLMGGFRLTGLWAADTAYSVNDIASSGEYTYVCKTAHTSGGVFEATNWIQFGFTAGADAAQAAAAAQVSAANALVSENNAETAATSALASETSASASATSASGSATTATTQASNAATSATSASNSASAAAASAAAITYPISVANGGTGSTNATDARTALGVPSNSGTGASGTWGVSISGNAATATAATTASNLNVTSAASFGYGTGAGGTVTQATSKSTAVTLNKPCGQITMNNAALAAGASVAFILNNSLLGVGDGVALNLDSSFAVINYSWRASCGAALAQIVVKNESAGSLSESLVFRFQVVKGATS